LPAGGESLSPAAAFLEFKMSSEQADAIIALLTQLVARHDGETGVLNRLENIEFYSSASALIVGWILGTVTWRLVVLAKNQSRIW
jgi:hypothetical protein